MKNLKPIILTICIPTFQRSMHLKNLLDCLLPQLTSEVEILIGDNFSNDGTQEVIEFFANSNSGINMRVVFHPENVGFDRNLLSLIRDANGSYCWLVSDDDLIYPDMVNKIVTAVKKNLELSLILVNYNRTDKFNPSRRSLKMIDILENHLFEDVNTFFFRKTSRSYMTFLGANIIFLSINIVSRELWLKVEPQCQQFVGLNMIHLFIISKMITLCPQIYFLSSPAVSYLAKNSRQWDNDIHKDYLFYYPSYLKEIGYDKSLVNKNFSEWPCSPMTPAEKISKFITRIPLGAKLIAVASSLKNRLFSRIREKSWG